MYSTGNYIQYLVITYNEEESKKEYPSLNISRKESDTTERLNWTDLEYAEVVILIVSSCIRYMEFGHNKTQKDSKG